MKTFNLMKVKICFLISLVLISMSFISKSTNLSVERYGLNDTKYSELTKGLPAAFNYTPDNKTNNGVVYLNGVRTVDVTYKSIEPMSIDKDGDKWYARFYFSEQTYPTEKYAAQAFENRINEFSKEGRFAAKCPYYSVRDKDKIYTLSTACNFQWKLDRLIKNFKSAFIKPESKLSVEIQCRSGGDCKTE